MVTRSARWKLPVAAGGIAVAAALAAGCASSGPAAGGTPSGAASSSAAASPASALCADAAALKASLDKLSHVTVGKGTADEIKADLADVQAALTALRGEARNQWQAQTSSLSSALAGLKSAAGDLAASPGASTVSGVAAALGAVKTSGQDLLAAVSTRCPSVSPSPGS